MSTPYICPKCGHPITFGNAATIKLHEVVSHSQSGNPFITEVTAKD